MTTRYEKQGLTTRLESSARGRSVVRLAEGGWAETDSGVFRCGPLEIDERPAYEWSSLTSIEDAIRDRVEPGADIERLTIVEGTARHALVSGQRARYWSESTARVFVTLVRRACGRRSSLELGAGAASEIDLQPIRRICQAFSLPDSDEPFAVKGLSLAPWVTAGLARALADSRQSPGKGIRVAQSPPPGSRDGNGIALRRRVVRASDPSWPHAFRPSYRFPPVRQPFHVEIAGLTKSVDSSGPEIVAVASTWSHVDGLRYSARAWIIDSSGMKIRLQRIVVDCARLAAARLDVDDTSSWYPEGAGAWGRKLILPAAAVEARAP